MPTLLLLRHAKSAYPPGVVDRDRPLSERGRKDADAAGRWIAWTVPVIDEVMVSPARRAQETWHRVSHHVASPVVRDDERIYSDWGSDLVSVVAECAAHSQTALVIGHNPGIEELALSLSSVASPMRERMSLKFPTAGIAMLRWDGDWRDPRAAELIAFAVPRG